MNENLENYASDYLNKKWNELNEKEKSVIESIQNRQHLSKNINTVLDDKRTFGERVADGVANFGGSWTFIIIFAVILLSWIFLNSLILLNKGFDPYPYILLNLFLSMLAAIQGPIIMMSQNRQNARDRLDAAHDYEVNLKAELEIRQLREKLDELREEKWAELVKMQQQQIEILQELLKQKV